jgi:hypothetical protein
VDFAGAVGNCCLLEVGFVHAGAIIGDPDAPVFRPQRNGDPGCAGIQGVFRQFPHRRRQRVYHLTGGDQVYDFCR